MKNTFFSLLGAILLGTLLAACSKPVPLAEPIRAVKVMAVGVDPVSSGYEFAADVRARVESKLSFQVSGKITHRQAELGQRVKVGQVLAQLDPQDYQLAADAARAQLRAAASNRDLAVADHKRYQELKDQNFISSAELERRGAAAKAAQAQYEHAQSLLALQGNQTAYTSLRANVAGIVTAVEAEPGQIVTAGTPVVRIAADGPRDVVFAVPEDKLAFFKPGMAVGVRSWAQDSQQLAVIREVGISADPTTRTYQVKVALSPKDTAPPLGATVYVLPQSSTSAAQQLQVIKLPTSALRRDGNTSAVWVLEPASMTVKSQTVQIATADANDAVIAAGLQPGMLVVSAGVHVLSPGQRVSIYQEKKAIRQASSAQTAINSVADSEAAMKPAPAVPTANAPPALPLSATPTTK